MTAHCCAVALSSSRLILWKVHSAIAICNLRPAATLADPERVRTLLAEQTAKANDAKDEYDKAVALVGQEVYSEMAAATQ